MNHPDYNDGDDVLWDLRDMAENNAQPDCDIDTLRRAISEIERLRAILDMKMPCDVRLPPATIIRKGCTFQTLLTGINQRTKDAPPHMSEGKWVRLTIGPSGLELPKFDESYVCEILDSAKHYPRMTEEGFARFTQADVNACYYAEVEEAKRRYFGGAE